MDYPIVQKAIRTLSYTPIELVYHGEKTVVCRAQDMTSGQFVIIKYLKQTYPSFGELVQFRNQYAITKDLPVPGIVKPLKLELLNNGYALIMEDGGCVCLSHYILQQSLSLTEVLEIATQLAAILHALHQHRVIHKDIKPANILIHPDTKQVWLIDFSIASLLPQENQAIQNPKSLEGTLAYMAPEQTGRMNRAIDYRTDFYALGVTLYELLTGQLPFPSDDPMELIHCHMAQMPRGANSLNPNVPAMVAMVLAKLMAKNAENRYQSALGFKHDVEQCLMQWQAQGKINDFALGLRDVSDRFLIPEKLYGRNVEVQTLLDAFERVSQGTSELMLVAGFSGIGKTAVVNEVHKPIVRQRGYFIKGKFDQFNRNIPFSAFVQSLRDLMGQLLSESDASLQSWKTQILEALGKNAQVIIDLIPELESITGQQPAAPELSGMAAQNRFNLLFQKFIQVFTAPAHPLVIFVDDLQWADSASLNLIQILMSEAQTGHLLLVGAYRDNEVSTTHPLMLTLSEISKVGAAIRTINLKPLKTADLNQLITDTLGAPAQTVRPLTDLVMQKTQGNPFFTAQFLNVLHQDRLISFDYDAGHWQCDMVQVEAAALTDDVVELMASQLKKLPKLTQEILKLAACIGAQFDLKTLATVSETSQLDVATALWRALQARIILPQSDVYKFYLETDSDIQDQTTQIQLSYHFLHDRVQQAAYSLIPDSQRQVTHLRLGKRLLVTSSETDLDDKIFDVVNHWNIGRTLVTAASDREQLCRLNLKAAIRAKRATAYDMAYQYALIGIKLLPTDSWQNQYDLMLTLHELASESAYLKGDFNASQQWSKTILHHAQTTLDEVKAHEISLLVHVAQRQPSQAIAIGQEILARLGVSISTTSPSADIQQAWAEVSALMTANQDAQSLMELPAMTNPQALAALKILNSLGATVYLTQPQLLPLVVLAQVKLSLLHGNTPVSAGAYARYSFFLCSKRNEISLGYEFGRLAIRLSEQFADKEISTRVLLMVGALTLPWTVHLKESIPLLQMAYQNGLESGNLDGAALSHYYESQSSYLVGEELQDLANKIATYSTQIQQIKQEFHLGNNALLHQITLNLIGRAEIPYKLSGQAFNEDEMLPLYQSSSNMLGLYCLHLHKAILNYWFSREEDSLKFITIAANYLGAATSQATVPLFHFYDSLVRLSLYATFSASEQASIIAQVNDNQKKLEYWAGYAPMNFQHKYDLVLAETYRCLGQKSEAIDAYDQAISDAKGNGYIQEEALANELAAKFYLSWGKDRLAAEYMQEAYYCYAHWGAKAKVADLEIRYSELLRPILQSAVTSMDMLSMLTTLSQSDVSVHNISRHSFDGTRINQALDFSSIFKASHTLSSTIQINELLHELTHSSLQISGADRCALILPNDQEEWRVRAIATSEDYQPCDFPLNTSQNLPVQLIQYVKNTHEVVVIDNLKTELPVLDDYLEQWQPQSILCLAILNQGRCIGTIFFENHFACGVFTNERIVSLKFLCTQAGISLENSRLYESVALKSFVIESSTDSMAILDDGRFVYLNEAHGALFGYELHELMGQSWEKLYSLEEINRIKETAFPILTQTGQWSGEATALRKDGSTFAEEVSLSLLENGKIICICRDISARKRLEHEQAQLYDSLMLRSSAIEASDAGIAILSDGKYIYLNSSHVALLGYEQHELIGESWENIYDSEEIERFSQQIFPLLTQQGRWFGEAKARRKDGSYFPQEVSLCALEDNKLICICRDISDRKRLEKNQARLNAVLEATPDWIGMANPQGKEIWRNQQLKSLRPDIAKQDLPSITNYHPDWVNQFMLNKVLPAASQQGSWSGETAILDIEGNEIPVSQVVIAHKTADGSIENYSTIMRDISDRKAAEASLRESETKFRTLLSNLDGVVYRCQNDVDWTMEFMSDAITTLSGYPVTDFIDNSERTYASLIHPNDVELVCEAVVRGLELKQSFTMEYRILHRDGSVRWVAEKGKGIFSNENELSCLEGVIFDISDRKRAEEAVLQKSHDLEKALVDLQNAQLQMVQSEKMSALGSLIAGVAHEINNPVGCIVGNVGAAQDYMSDLLGLLESYAGQFPEPGADIENELEAVDLNYVREDLPKLVRAMKDSGDRIKAISTSLRTFSRADMDTKQAFNLHEGIDSTVLILRHRLKANEQRPAIEIITDYGDIPDVNCFPGQLNQVFMNILANAIDALDEASPNLSFDELEAHPQRIIIRTSVENSLVKVAIADNGPGIPEDAKSKIFDHLFTTKRVGQGTGLGLAIAHQIVVETHGGHLSVKSEKGQGAKFCVQLPIEGPSFQVS
ncbi:MAG: PAS domain S-box protein [Cyanobacteria bacterium P01_F01_bin.150]